jgi:hypothetical protein
MKYISRRHLARTGLLLPPALLGTVVPAQEENKPAIKWSEAKPIIREYVERMSQASKNAGGAEFTFQQKSELVDTNMAKMEAQHVYHFFDP